MLNVFQNSSDKSKLVRFKTAYVKQDDGIKYPFKYYKLAQEDINRNNFLRGIEMQVNNITIRTISNYDFDVHTKILIDNKQYSVNYIYKEDQEQLNGLYRKKMKPFVYLVLNN